ncbi:hypothetical protein AWC38_SpisGene5197 [Stylophora pistillata]|uniref:OTU domain-containing protein n=1 Tax=Stylophora pistillata TaxID=50429 RepID=A0A2B4SKW1_STYPI|nr:hypothetical protein AWC38_SpisGene5197 [Stylophora pistillata]
MPVQQNLPASNSPFTVEKYKRDLLKPSPKMYSWLCTKDDFESANNVTRNDSEDHMLTKPAFEACYNSSTVACDVPIVTSPEVAITSTFPDLLNKASTSSTSYHWSPTCLDLFHQSKIMVHADTCAEAWVDPIGDPDEVDDTPPNEKSLVISDTHSSVSDGVPNADKRALSNDEFKAVGELMACSLIQEGPAPCFLSINVYDYFIDGIASVQSDKWASLIIWPKWTLEWFQLLHRVSRLLQHLRPWTVKQPTVPRFDLESGDDIEVKTSDSETQDQHLETATTASGYTPTVNNHGYIYSGLPQRSTEEMLESAQERIRLLEKILEKKSLHMRNLAGFNLTAAKVARDGDCTFRSVARTLRPICNPEQSEILNHLKSVGLCKSEDEDTITMRQLFVEEIMKYDEEPLAFFPNQDREAFVERGNPLSSKPIFLAYHYYGAGHYDATKLVGAFDKQCLHGYLVLGRRIRENVRGKTKKSRVAVSIIEETSSESDDADVHELLVTTAENDFEGAKMSSANSQVAANQIYKYMAENQLFPAMQSAYCKYYSTETALLKVSNDILRAVDQNQEVVLVLLDLSAAFDTTVYNINYHKVVVVAIAKRYQKGEQMKKGMDIKLSKTNIRNQVGGSLLTSILSLGRTLLPTIGKTLGLSALSGLASEGASQVVKVISGRGVQTGGFLVPQNKINQLIQYRHSLIEKQKRDILGALQTGQGVHIKPTKYQMGSGIGTILASIGIPMAIDLVKNLISGKGAPQMGGPPLKGVPAYASTICKVQGQNLGKEILWLDSPFVPEVADEKYQNEADNLAEQRKRMEEEQQEKERKRIKEMKKKEKELEEERKKKIEGRGKRKRKKIEKKRRI